MRMQREQPRTPSSKPRTISRISARKAEAEKRSNTDESVFRPKVEKSRKLKIGRRPLIVAFALTFLILRTARKNLATSASQSCLAERGGRRGRSGNRDNGFLGGSRSA